MRELEWYMHRMRKPLVDEVENEGVNVIYPQLDLANKLNELFPMRHGDEIGRLNKTHLVWSRALRDLTWLGWLSEAKRRDGRYDDRICDALIASLIQAFEIGRRYSEERP